MRWLVGLCVALSMMTGMAGMAAAQNRWALVVGVDTYENVSSLMKARNDAIAIHETLSAAGVQSTLVLDPTSMGMVEALTAFVAQLGPGDEAVFFFAGHGVQIDNRNYLLMSDIPSVTPGSELMLTRQALPVDVVLEEMRAKGTRALLVILDACRDNPFPRDGQRSLGGERGLAATEAPEGTFIMFSAGDGQTALDRLSNDDPDPNSVFTRSLLPYLAEPGLPVHEMARLVRTDVRELAATVGHPQFPAIYDQFDGVFTLIPSAMSEAVFAASEAPDVAPVPAPVSSDPCAMALPLWQALELSPTPEALRAFIATQSGCEVLRVLAESRLEAVLAAAPDAPAAPADEPVAAPVAQAEPVTPGVAVFAPSSRVHVLGSAALTPDGEQAFGRDFSTAIYFGAFAVAKDGGWGYFTGVNSRVAARELALAECRRVSPDCAIYAELLPSDYADPGPGTITLGPDAARVYREAETDLGFHAMAVSADGAYAKIWSAATQDAADQQALADCESYRSDAPAAAGMACILLPQP